MKTSSRPSRLDLLVPAHVNLGAPRVVHCMSERHHVYIGRPEKWGNPFIVGRDGARGDCIPLFERWLLDNAELMAALGELRGLVLRMLVRPSPLSRRCAGAAR